MAPRIARETKRVWSINVKREEGGFWLLNCKGGHQHTHGSATAFGHWSRSHRRTHPSLRCQPSLPAKPAVPWGSGGYVDLDGVVIQSSHVQINPKQSGLEMPRFGRAADETGQDSTELTGLDSTSHHGAPQARRHETDWIPLDVLWTFPYRTERGLISTGHVVVSSTYGMRDASVLGDISLACPLSFVLCPCLVCCSLFSRARGLRGELACRADELPTRLQRSLRIKPPVAALVLR